MANESEIPAGEAGDVLPPRKRSRRAGQASPAVPYWRLIKGDCLEAMRLAAARGNTVQAIVTDPPYGLEFMGKGWDKGVPGVEFWQAAYDVLPPGGYLVAFSSSRTYHILASAIEAAGFEIRDQLMWLYGTGFPKSHDVSKAIDKAAGVERELGGASSTVCSAWNRGEECTGHPGTSFEGRHQRPTLPSTDDAKRWEGWGTALKPAHEPIVLARKPFKGTVAANVLEHGTGAINVDACRVGPPIAHQPGGLHRGSGNTVGSFYGDYEAQKEAHGRWPANVVLSYPEDEYLLREDVTQEQKEELYGWMCENA